MSYRLIILAPSAGGKSTLMRYLRKNTDLEIAETDEEVMTANGGVWPSDTLKNEVLVPETTREIIKRKNVIYFASYIPEELVRLARKGGFKVLLLEVPLEVLRARNERRMLEESYDDVSRWQEAQLDDYKNLKKAGLTDGLINGNRDVEEIMHDIMKLAVDQQG